MPRFTELTAQAIKELQEQGKDPAGNDWIMDSETGEIWERDAAPEMSVGERVQAGLANVPVGLGQSLSSIPDVAASATGSLRQLGVRPEILGPFNQPEFLSGASSLLKKAPSKQPLS